jgi:hypothetical protein
LGNTVKITTSNNITVDFMVVEFDEIIGIKLFPLQSLHSQIIFNGVTTVDVRKSEYTQMNDTSTTNGGYLNSKMKRITLPILLEEYRKILGDHLNDEYFDLLDAYELCGEQSCQIEPDPNISSDIIKARQLALFKILPIGGFRGIETFWLRGVVDYTSFCTGSISEYDMGSRCLSAVYHKGIHPLVVIR